MTDPISSEIFNKENLDSNLELSSEYLRILTHWLFLDRGDNSQNSAHADPAIFLSID